MKNERMRQRTLGSAALVLAVFFAAAGLVFVGLDGPVAQAATNSTFGNTTAGSGSSSPAADYKFGSVYPLSQSGTAVSFSWYTKGGAAAEQMKPVVYAVDSAGNPTTTVAVGAEVKVAANQAAGWLTSALPTVSLPAGKYLLGLLAGPASGQVTDYYTPSSGAGIWNPNTYGTPSSTWVPSTVRTPPTAST